MLNRHSHRGIPVERHTTGNHLIHDNTQGIDIASSVHVTVSGLLRGSVVNRSHHIRVDGVGGGGSGNAEVRYLDLSLRGNDNVLGFDIPMNDILLVGRLDAPSHLDGNADGLFEVQPALLFNISLEGNTLHIFHHDIVHAVLAAYIVDIDNVGMLQTRRRLGLRAEFRHKGHVLGELRLQHLYRDLPVQNVILCLVDIRHTAGADFIENFISIRYKCSSC